MTTPFVSGWAYYDLHDDPPLGELYAVCVCGLSWEQHGPQGQCAGQAWVTEKRRYRPLTRKSRASREPY